jgi:hypothetical protein
MANAQVTAIAFKNDMGALPSAFRALPGDMIRLSFWRMIMRAFLAGVSAFLMFVSLSYGQTFSAADANHHIGEHATVCGTIASERTASSSRGSPTFVNLDKPYPSQIFTIVVWSSDLPRVGSLPTSGRICATGTITDYRGVPEIVVRDAQSWYTPK